MFRREVSRTENRMRFVPKAVSVCISEGYGADCSKVASMRTRHDTAAARQRPALSGFRLRVSVGVGYLADGVRDGRRCKERLPALPTILRPSRAARRSPDGRWAGAFVRNLAPLPHGQNLSVPDFCRQLCGRSSGRDCGIRLRRFVRGEDLEGAA